MNKRFPAPSTEGFLNVWFHPTEGQDNNLNFGPELSPNDDDRWELIKVPDGDDPYGDAIRTMSDERKQMVREYFTDPDDPDFGRGKTLTGMVELTCLGGAPFSLCVQEYDEMVGYEELDDEDDDDDDENVDED